MKKLITLAVAGCMVLGSLATASAIDVKVGGQWYFHYGYYSNNQLVSKEDSGKHSDRTRARQRIRTQIEFIADENLSALLNIEANMHWGYIDKDKKVNGTGGGLDADNTTFVIKHAYLNWTIPNTEIKTRMGMQGIKMPSVAFGNPVMDADVAGITVSNQFTPELGLTVFWARPYDRSYYSSDDQAKGKNSMDDMDMFGIMLPIKTDIVRATPWGMFAMIGRDSDFYGEMGKYTLDANTGSITAGKYTANKYNYNRGTRTIDTSKMDSTTYGWWAGTTLELPVLDPFFVKVDAMMGGLETGESDYDMFGWMVAADIGYKFSWGALSAIGWYSSGDDDDDDLGQLPIISDDSGFLPTRYGTAGSYIRSFDRVLTGTGNGMWGIGLKVADVSFVDNLKHTLIGVYMGGTNKGDSVDIHRKTGSAAGDSWFGGNQLATSDRAWEIDLINQYKVNDNLTLSLDFAYVWLDLGDSWANKNDTDGSFATMIGVQYSF